MKRTILTGALVLLLCQAMAQNSAQTATSGTAPRDGAVTLEALVSQVLEQNPERQFYEAEVAATRAGHKSAGLWSNPELSGDVGHRRISGSGLGAEGVAWSVALMQPFEWPGRLSLRKAIANQDIELAELGLERFQRSLAGRTRTLAYGLFAAREKAAAAKAVADRFRALREVLLQRDPAGLTPLLETRVIEATEVALQRRATEAEMATRRAVFELNTLRGAPTDAPLRLRATTINFRDVDGQTTLLALAGTNNFELQSRAVELAQQGLRIELARKERFSLPALGPVFSEERAGSEREQVVGVGFSLPLPLWSRNNPEIESAAARRLQAEVSLSVATRDVERKVLEAASEYDSRVRDLSRWRPDAVEHFGEAAELADRHYRLGAVSVSTYVELQKEYLEAVQTLFDTKLAALVAAESLEALTGLKPPLVSITTKEDK